MTIEEANDRIHFLRLWFFGVAEEGDAFTNAKKKDEFVSALKMAEKALEKQLPTREDKYEKEQRKKCLEEYGAIASELHHINYIIKEAWIHGGDTGGTYDINEEELVKVMNCYLRYKGWDSVAFVADIPYEAIKYAMHPKTLFEKMVEEDEQ